MRETRVTKREFEVTIVMMTKRRKNMEKVNEVENHDPGD